jgi:pectate lyase
MTARARRLAPMAALAIAGLACGDRRLVSLSLPPDTGDASSSDAPPADAPSGDAPAPADHPPPGVCPDQLVGYGAGTVGGQGGDVVTVTTAADLQTQASRTVPVIIQIDGTISMQSGQIRVKSQKTIVGLGAASGLDGFGLNLTDSSDVVIRNLRISKAVGTDAVSLNHSTHVWIDHCDLSSAIDDGQSYDGLVDITHASDAVTVSWTRLHDHLHPSTIGHDDGNASEDTGHLNVTLHHDLFATTHSYNPSIRFGTLHAFDNHYVGIMLNGIASRMGARVLAEANVFDTVPTPLTTHFESPTDGFMNFKAGGNIFINSGPNDITQEDTWTPPYAYVVDPATAVPDLVNACAGTGRVAAGSPAP